MQGGSGAWPEAQAGRHVIWGAHSCNILEAFPGAAQQLAETGKQLPQDCTLALNDWLPYPGVTKLQTRYTLLVAFCLPLYMEQLDEPVFLLPIVSLKLVSFVLSSFALDTNE